MTAVRSATADDLPALEELWRAFEAEVPPPAHETVDVATELAEIRDIVDSGLGWLAEKDGIAIGMILARRRGARVGRITDLYVRPAERRAGVAEALARAVAVRFAADGVDTIDLEVMASNAAARATYARWGFRDEVLVLAAPTAALAERLGEEEPVAASFGSIHAQTDDVDVIQKAVEMYVPRLPGRSRGSIVTQPRNGYVTVYDDVCDRDPAMLRRLAKDISSRTGLVVIAVGVEEEALVRMIIFDRGGIVDEYASVPEFHGPLPPGEVIAMHANPVVVERYTGAPQAAVRAAAPVATAPADLVPARELLAGLALTLGLAGTEHGWADATDDDVAHRVAR
jgi:ribosomal protein S18 acetylase RimI-like enzyme